MPNCPNCRTLTTGVINLAQKVKDERIKRQRTINDYEKLLDSKEKLIESLEAELMVYRGEL